MIQEYDAETRRLSEFNGIIDALYAGTAEAPGWGSFLQRLRDATGSMYACMAAGDRDSWYRRAYFFEGKSRGPGDCEQTQPDFLELSPFSRLPQDVVTTIGELVDAGHSIPPGFCSDVMEPYGIGDIIGANFIRRGTRLAHFRLGRPPSAGRYSARDKDLCRLVLPHLHRACERAAAFEPAAAWQPVLFETLQSLGIGAILIDSRRKILDASGTALEIIGAHRTLVSTRNGYLHLLHQPDDVRLGAAVERLSNGTAPAAQSFRAAGGTGAAALHFVCNRGPEPPAFHQAPWTVIFVSSDRTRRPIALQTLRDLFGLTCAESRIALGLISGLSMAQIAARGGVSRNTAYTHLKSAFDKLGVSQQSALVSRLLSGVALLGRE